MCILPFIFLLKIIFTYFHANIHCTFGLFEFVVIRNNISVNILVCASWHAQACIYIGRIPQGEAADSQEVDISNSVR